MRQSQCHSGNCICLGAGAGQLPPGTLGTMRIIQRAQVINHDKGQVFCFWLTFQKPTKHTLPQQPVMCITALSAPVFSCRSVDMGYGWCNVHQALIAAQFGTRPLSESWVKPATYRNTLWIILVIHDGTPSPSERGSCLLTSSCICWVIILTQSFILHTDIGTSMNPRYLVPSKATNVTNLVLSRH